MVSKLCVQNKVNDRCESAKWHGQGVSVNLMNLNHIKYYCFSLHFPRIFSKTTKLHYFSRTRNPTLFSKGNKFLLVTEYNFKLIKSLILIIAFLHSEKSCAVTLLVSWSLLRSVKPVFMSHCIVRPKNLNGHTERYVQCEVTCLLCPYGQWHGQGVHSLHRLGTCLKWPHVQLHMDNRYIYCIVRPPILNSHMGSW